MGRDPHAIVCRHRAVSPYTSSFHAGYPGRVMRKGIDRNLRDKWDTGLAYLVSLSCGTLTSVTKGPQRRRFP